MTGRFSYLFSLLSLLVFTICVGFFTPEDSYAYETFPVPETAEVTLAWDPVEPIPDGYRLYHRKEGDSYDYSQPCWAGTDATGTVYNLQWETSYSFVVRAYVGNQESANSNEVTFHSPSTPQHSFTITVTADENGVVSPGASVTIDAGSDQLFNISPDSGYQISDVRVDGESVGPVSSYTFTAVDANHTIDVDFVVKSYSISASAGAGGTINPAGTTAVNHASTTTYQITSDTGYAISDVVVDDVSMGPIASYSFTDVSSSHTISASFSRITHMITASILGNGSISPAGAAIVDHGASTTYTLSPDEGWHVVDVIVDGSSVGAVNSYTFDNVTLDHTLSAVFEANSYTISVAAEGNGTVSPCGSISMEHGESQAFSFVAANGFHVSDVRVDGQSIGTMGAHTLDNISANHSVWVSFSENTPVSISLEAEEGDILAPMEIGDDQSASAGGYIWASNGAGDFTTPSVNAGVVQFHFNLPEAGNYAVWGRQISNDTASDSFFVSIDDQPEMAWHTKPGGQEVWTWDVVSERDGADPDYSSGPEVYQLDAGDHTLTISQREDGTKLDQLLITNDLIYIPEEPNTITDVIEFDQVELNQNWQRVSFSKPFKNPIVVAGPVGNNGRAPVTVRIQNVSATGFTIRLQEWGYLDGAHTKEIVSYLVIEQGTYTLADGTKVEAGKASGKSVFKQIAFEESFNVPPIVMTSIGSFNDKSTVTGRVRYITVDGFQYRLKEQEANTQDHELEEIHYLAWEPSAGKIGETDYLVRKTDDVISHKSYTISFAKDFGSAPVFLAAMQTHDGGDTANLRCDNKTNLSVDVWVDEEQSRDPEANHTKEVVGYMLFSQ